MEKRKIIKFNGIGYKRYQILKPKDNGKEDCWHGYGMKKSLNGINNFLLMNEREELFDIEISDEIVNEIEEYRREREEKKILYLSNSRLVSKVI